MDQLTTASLKLRSNPKLVSNSSNWSFVFSGNFGIFSSFGPWFNEDSRSLFFTSPSFATEAELVLLRFSFFKTAFWESVKKMKIIFMNQYEYSLIQYFCIYIYLYHYIYYLFLCELSFTKRILTRNITILRRILIK